MGCDPRRSKSHRTVISLQFNFFRDVVLMFSRMFIIRGFVAGKIHKHRGGEEVALRCALDILEWGNAGPWKDVPVSTKGDIFARKFVRTVRTLHMIAYKEVRT